MTITNFKSMIAAYMNRTTASLTSVNSQDILLQAMNDARRAAQRAHVFELNRVDCFLATTQAGANWMTGCKTTPGGATASLMRRIDSVWNYSTSGSIYYRTSRIDFGSIFDYKRELDTDPGNQALPPAQSITTSRKFAFINGPLLCVNTITSSTNVMLNGIKWLDDLTGSEDPDIFLTFFTDWFKYATIAALNVYLKDSERFPIDTNAMNSMWQTVKAMDGTIANAGDGADLN
jgi:hypothetical protein